MPSRYHLMLLSAALLFASPHADAQRRKRPGSMHHTQQEVASVTEKKTVSGKYIRNGSRFAGQARLVGEAGAIKIGSVTIAFSGGRYNFTFLSAQYQARRSMTKEQRMREGISDYTYERMWKAEKYGEDFAADGLYEVIEQRGEATLYLYHGNDKGSVFATIPLTDKDADSFMFDEGGIIFHLDLTR